MAWFLELHVIRVIQKSLFQCSIEIIDYCILILQIVHKLSVLALNSLIFLSDFFIVDCYLCEPDILDSRGA